MEHPIESDVLPSQPQVHASEEHEEVVPCVEKLMASQTAERPTNDSGKLSSVIVDVVFAAMYKDSPSHHAPLFSLEKGSIVPPHLSDIGHGFC